MAELLYGRNAVRESLRAHRRALKRLLVATGAEEGRALNAIIDLAEQVKVPISRVERQALDRQTRHAHHQGVALEAGDYPYVEIEECLALPEQCREPAFFLLLDHLQDPQNVGTLLRTAEVVGVHGVVLPGRRSAGITPAVVNASSGATEHLRIVMVSNLAQTMGVLQREGIWVVGVENDPRAQEFDQVDLNLPLALVVGAEGSGLARLTRERCDFLVRLPMRGQVASFNAAVAGSIMLYYAWRQRTRAES